MYHHYNYYDQLDNYNYKQMVNIDYTRSINNYYC